MLIKNSSVINLVCSPNSGTTKFVVSLLKTGKLASSIVLLPIFANHYLKIYVQITP